MEIKKAVVDGRIVEVHVTETVNGNATQRVTERYEEVVPLEMKQRVTETVMPVVVERVLESFDGKTSTKTVEKLAGTDLSPSSSETQPAVRPLSSFFPAGASDVFTYILIAVLAVGCGWTVWTLFLR